MVYNYINYPFISSFSLFVKLSHISYFNAKVLFILNNFKGWVISSVLEMLKFKMHMKHASETRGDVV